MHKLLLAAIPVFGPVLLAQGTPEVEPNDTIATATALELGGQGDGTIEIQGDVDLWKITVTGPADLRLWLNPGFLTPLGDSDLALLGPDGTTVLAFNDDVDGMANWLSLLVIGNLAAGDYYLRVRSSLTYDATGTGAYTIDAIAAAPGTYVAIPAPLAPIAESAEGNDPRIGGGAVTASTVDSTNVGYISRGNNGLGYDAPSADYDFYQIQVPVAGVLTMTTRGGPVPSATDTSIHLVDESLARIAFDDDSGTDFFSRLTYNVTAPGIYSVVVSDWGTGNYILDITLTAPLPVGAATVTILPGGCGGVTLSTRAITQPPASTIHTEVPELGSTFYLDGEGMEAYAPGFRVVGISTLAVPFDLGTVGGPAGCNVEVDPLSVVFVLADELGRYPWGLATPASLDLVGLPLMQQLVALHSTLGLVASNRVASVCGVSN